MESETNSALAPRAVIPPFELTPPPGSPPSRADFLIAELVRRFGGRVEHHDDPDSLPVVDSDLWVSQKPEKNPEWKNFGFRGRVAELLWNRGLEKKAIRFANCGRMGRPGVCTRYPLEHRFYEPHPCSMIFCRECADKQRGDLLRDYVEVVLSVLREHGVPEGWVLARVNFTLRSDGSEITPSGVKKFNSAVRAVMRKIVGSARGFGMLFVDEVGFETRGHLPDAQRRAHGLNLHCHGIYFGPWDRRHAREAWRRARDLWKAETERRYGVPSTGFFIRWVKGFDSDPERAVRHALRHMLKYTSKPPAVTAERLASLIAAFDGARRVHSLGLFYGRKPKREKKDCPCPRCRAMGIASAIEFDGRRLANGGCLPRLVLVEELRAGGYEDLREARRAVFFEGAIVTGAGPP